MNLKLQLKILSFLQFCLWGSWLTTLGSYMFVTLKFDGASIGAVYSSLGIAAVFMPTLLGIVADKWLSAKWVYALCHVVGAITLFMAAEVTTPGAMFFVILLNSLAYMPTLGLINTISYYRLQSAGMDIVTDFPPIRIWGTIGFILAMWGVSFSGFELSHMQLYIGATLSVLLVLFTFTLPHIPVANQQKNQSWTSMLGLDAFALFKNKRMAIFFIFSMMLGAELQITNMFGNTFLHSFDKDPLFASSFIVQHASVMMSISQISETLFILTIPFFLSRYGTEKLRGERQYCRQVTTFVRTSPFAVKEPCYSNAAVEKLPLPTQDSRDIIAAACRALNHVWREGYRYMKAGVMLADFTPSGIAQPGLFDEIQPRKNSEKLMKTLDELNQSGKGKVWFAGRGTAPEWQMKREMLSQCYTTKWRDIPLARLG